MISVRFLTVVLLGAAVFALLTGCGNKDNSGSTPRPEAPGKVDAGVSTQREVISKSGVAMVMIPAGEFNMGTDKGNADEGPPHKVKISAFLMDKTEVTQEMYAKAQLPNPSRWQDNPQNPVERVRWRDAKMYCNERSIMEGLTPCYDEKKEGLPCNYEANGYRLPTEAEWEYACRGGGELLYDFGPQSKLKQFAWYEENSNQRTHPVGQKKPNSWGLLDMYGNVSEWCEDVYQAEYYKQSPAADPKGPAGAGKETKSVLRGGSWKSSLNMCRATFRQAERTGDTDACFYTDYCGFRCVRRDMPAEGKAPPKAASN